MYRVLFSLALALMADEVLCAREHLHNARQLIMPGALPTPTASTSSFNWWPYPPEGTTPTPSPNLAPEVEANVQSIVTENSPAFSFNEDELSSLHEADQSFSSSPDSSSTPSTSSSKLSSSSISIITITATSSTALPSPLIRYPKKNPAFQSPQIVYYLIPVFIIVGLIIGSVSAWFVFACWARRRKATGLEVGPSYGDLGGDDELDTKWRRDITERNLITDEKKRDAADRYTWADVEQESFLDPPIPANPATPRKPLSRHSTAKTTKSMSVYSQVCAEDEDQVHGFLNEYESEDEGDRTRRRNTHTRQHSDYTPTATEMQRGKSDVSGWGWDALSPGATIQRAKSNWSALSRDSSSPAPTGDVKREKSLGGFRIMEESPLSTPALTNPFSGWGKQKSTDTYTEIPKRASRSPAKKISAEGQVRRPGAGNIKRTRGRAVAKEGKEKTSHPLPQSPRQITSPKLDGTLCFTPMLDG